MNVRKKLVLIASSAIPLLFLGIFWSIGTGENQGAEATVLPQSEIGAVDSSDLQFYAAPGIENTADEPQDLIERGKSIVVISANENVAIAERGATTIVPLILTYHAGVDDDSEVTVQFDRIPGILFPPSVVKATTEEERIAGTSAGETMQGAIDLTSFVQLTPASISLKDNEPVSVTMQIVLPPSFSSEISDEIVNFTPSFRLSQQDSGREVLIYSPAVPIKVAST